MNTTVKCVVACTNSIGESNMYFVKVDVTGKNQVQVDKKIDAGRHKTAAKRAAKDNGMVGPFVVIDEYEESEALFDLFVWESASTVTV